MTMGRPLKHFSHACVVCVCVSRFGLFSRLGMLGLPGAEYEVTHTRTHTHAHTRKHRHTHTLALTHTLTHSPQLRFTAPGLIAAVAENKVAVAPCPGKTTFNLGEMLCGCPGGMEATWPGGEQGFALTPEDCRICPIGTFRVGLGRDECEVHMHTHHTPHMTHETWHMTHNT